MSHHRINRGISIEQTLQPYKHSTRVLISSDMLTESRNVVSGYYLRLRLRIAVNLKEDSERSIFAVSVTAQSASGGGL